MSRKYKTEDAYEQIPLSAEELNKELAQLPNWNQVREGWIAREYKFTNYLDGVNFAQQIGEYAEQRQHHPLIQINYKKVTIELSSWRVKGITVLDIEMVSDFNQIYKGEMKHD